jgi:hypothetical protein
MHMMHAHDALYHVHYKLVIDPSEHMIQGALRLFDYLASSRTLSSLSGKAQGMV